MKILVGLFLLFVFVHNSFAAPLLMRATKEITTEDFTEIILIDTAKYKQIRIGVKYAPSKDLSDYQKSQIAKKKDLLDKGIISRAEYDREVAGIENDRQYYVEIFAMENDDSFFINSISGGRRSGSVNIENPPAKISVQVQGKGKYTVSVWGE